MHKRLTPLDQAGPTGGHVCPWWLIWTFDNPIRRLFQPPERILTGLVRAGDHCLDVGCGIGYFTIPMASMVGEQGWVTAVDVQKRMLDGMMRRARRRGLESRVRARVASESGLPVEEPVDFALAFWMLHEVRNQVGLLRQLFAALKPGGLLLVAEPRLHVSGSAFTRSVERARSVGFDRGGEPAIAMSRAVLLTRRSSEALRMAEAHDE